MNNTYSVEDNIQVRRLIITSGVIILMAFSIISLGFASEQKSQRSESSIGETIEYFDLVGENGEKIDVSDLRKKEISAIFVFSQCHTCEKNIPLWKRLAFLFKTRMKVYGIILDELSKMIDLSNSSALKLELYCPEDQLKFIKEFKIKKNSAQTILYKDNMIVYRKEGILEMRDYFEIVKLIEEE